MSKLLNEQELTERLNNLLASANYRGILKLIQSQKIAHADMVIGDDEWHGDLVNGYQRKTVDTIRNKLRSEQREINK